MDIEPNFEFNKSVNFEILDTETLKFGYNGNEMAEIKVSSQNRMMSIQPTEEDPPLTISWTHDTVKQNKILFERLNIKWTVEWNIIDSSRSSKMVFGNKVVYVMEYKDGMWALQGPEL